VGEQQQLPRALRSFAQAGHAAGFRLTQTVLGPGRSSRRLEELARRMHREFDSAVGAAFAALPGPGAACAPGCDHCCRTLKVTASPVEVFSICRRLQEAGTPDPELEERLARPEAAPTDAGAPRPCPLLSEAGTCLVYSSRPLACRGCVSADAELCAACDDDRPVPRSMLHHLGAAAFLKGMTDALDEMGLVGEPTELRAALLQALRAADQERRWLRGERVFPPYEAR